MSEFQFPADALADRFKSLAATEAVEAVAVTPAAPPAQGAFRRGPAAAREGEARQVDPHDRATERQIGFIRKLLAEREGVEAADVVRARLNGWRESGGITKAGASKAIDDLLAIAKPEAPVADEVENKGFNLSPKSVDRANPHPGVYTVKLSDDDDDYRAFDVSIQPEDDEFAPGKYVLSMLVGPDRKEKGLGFLRGGRFLAWKSRAEFVKGETQRAIDILLAWDGQSDQVVLAKRCIACPELLTRPDSIERGIGPVCAKKPQWVGFA